MGNKPFFSFLFLFLEIRGARKGFWKPTLWKFLYLITEMSNKYDINELEGII